MDKRSYIKPSSTVNNICMESLLAGSFPTSDSLPTKDDESNQFSKNHKPGSLWDSSCDDDNDNE